MMFTGGGRKRTGNGQNNNSGQRNRQRDVSIILACYTHNKIEAIVHQLISNLP